MEIDIAVWVVVPLSVAPVIKDALLCFALLCFELLCFVAVAAFNLGNFSFMMRRTRELMQRGAVTDPALSLGPDTQSVTVLVPDSTGTYSESSAEN